MQIIKIFSDYFSDEYALVSAVRDIGAVFFRRTPDSVIIDFVSERESRSLASSPTF